MKNSTLAGSTRRRHYNPAGIEWISSSESKFDCSFGRQEANSGKQDRKTLFRVTRDIRSTRDSSRPNQDPLVGLSNSDPRVTRFGEWGLVLRVHPAQPGYPGWVIQLGSPSHSFRRCGVLSCASSSSTGIPWLGYPTRIPESLVPASVLHRFRLHVESASFPRIKLRAQAESPEFELIFPLDAFHDFIESSVTEEDLTSSILPSVEKSVLRSPEVSLLGMLTMLVSCRPLI